MRQGKVAKTSVMYLIFGNVALRSAGVPRYAMPMHVYAHRTAPPRYRVLAGFIGASLLAVPVVSAEVVPVVSAEVVPAVSAEVAIAPAIPATPSPVARLRELPKRVRREADGSVHLERNPFDEKRTTLG